jgi:hypothetical protein
MDIKCNPIRYMPYVDMKCRIMRACISINYLISINTKPVFRDRKTIDNLLQFVSSAYNIYRSHVKALSVRSQNTLKYGIMSKRQSGTHLYFYGCLNYVYKLNVLSLTLLIALSGRGWACIFIFVI